MATSRWQVTRTEAGEVGRRLVITEEIKQRNSVLQETPYARVLHSDQVQQRCACCLAAPGAGNELSRCSACQSAYYLNRSHQKADWDSGHKLECKVLKAARSGAPGGAPAPPGRVLPATVRLAISTVLRAHREGDLNSFRDADMKDYGGFEADDGQVVGPPAGLAGVLSLLSHWDDLPDATKIKCAQMGAWAW